MQPILASFWKARRVDEVVSDNDDGKSNCDTDVVDKGADVVYKEIIGSDDSDEGCNLNCVVTTYESSSEMESNLMDSDLMDSHDIDDTDAVGVELNTDSQLVINLDKGVSVLINDDPETESSSNSCDAECCNGDGPYHPRINYLTVSKRRQGKYFFSHLGIILLNGEATA